MTQKSVERQEINKIIVGRSLEGMKDVSDRFLGVASELGREKLPIEQLGDYLVKVDLLIFDFSKWFPRQFFSSAQEAPKQWTRLGDVARASQTALNEQLQRLRVLAQGQNHGEYDRVFKDASAILQPLAEGLRSTLLNL